MTKRNEHNETLFKIRYGVWVCLFLVLVILAVYWQVRNFGFSDFDDNALVAENRYVEKGFTKRSIAWSFALTEKDGTYWHPLTWLSHILDCQLYGMRPGMHHLTSLILHIANSLLLFLVFKRMTGRLWASAFVASLFALHPLNVETVAWVAERKNVLSTFFWMLTMLAYARYSERPGLYWYLVTFFVFALGLMAKPMLVSLPFVMLLFDYWPLGRVHLGQQDGSRQRNKAKSIMSNSGGSSVFRLMLEKAPFFVLSLISVYISSLSLQRAGNMLSTESVPMKLRISNALVSYVSYIGKTIWPQDLAVLYPYPHMVPMWKATLAGLFLALVSLLVLLRVRRKPYLTVGWLWFLGTLVPAIGLVQAGLWPAMADRWGYVPLIGLFIMISWGGAELPARWRHKEIGLTIVAATILSVLTVTTWLQLRHWHDDITLFQHAVDVTTDNHVAHNNLGAALVRQGRLEDGIHQYAEALRIKPDYAEAHNNLGAALSKQGRIAEATGHYHEALRIDPDYAMAHYNLGTALSKQGRTDEGIQCYNQALHIDPDYAEAHNNLGAALSKQGRIAEAIRHYHEALRIDPDYEEALYNLGSALSEQGRTDEAIGRYSEALRIKPDYAEAHNNLGAALSKQGRIAEAIRHYHEALRIDPDYGEAHNNLGNVLSEQGRIDEAIRHYSEALRIDPEDAMAHYNLGNALSEQGRIDEAIGHYNEALRIRPHYAEVHNNLGNVLSKEGRTDEAIRHYNEALRIDPEDAMAHYNLGNALSEQGRIDEAIGHYNEALRIDPGDALAHCSLGDALSKQDRTHEAIRHYNEAIRIDPKYEKAHSNLGIALMQQNRKDEAMRHFREALLINPDDAEVNSNLGVALALVGKFDEAIGYFQEALRIDPHYVKARINLKKVSSMAPNRKAQDD